MLLPGWEPLTWYAIYQHCLWDRLIDRDRLIGHPCSTSIKQVKSLELILSVPFAFGSSCCEPTLCGQMISPYKWNRQLLDLKTKQIHQRDSRNIRSGQINSFVHSEKKKRTHWWAQQHKKAWTSAEDNSGGWSEDPLHGKKKLFHNIQPREEHSPGGRRVTVKVYNPEKTSPEQIQRIHHNVETRPD